jgi:hypothetical protein
MKNVHIIPTDKPSRLYKSKITQNIFIGDDISQHGDATYNLNIYITSDEKIKVGDWVIEFQKGDDIGEVHFINSEYVIAGDIQKKIILTTDQDLIKDGVQAIDDEFLEWFVKNPTCEYVEIEEKDIYKSTTYDQPDRFIGIEYKIIIPQEEDEQDDSGVHLRHCYQGEYKDSCKYGEDDCPAKPSEEHKQETLEEAAKLYIGVPIDRIIDGEERYYTSNISEYDAFIAGAKWQAERMYSEEEVLDILDKFLTSMVKGEKTGLIDEWFEQFKKK